MLALSVLMLAVISLAAHDYLTDPSDGDAPDLWDAPRVDGGGRGYNPNIVVDGDIDPGEWRTADQIDTGGWPYDEGIDVSNADFDIMDAYIANDNSYAYLRITVAGTVTMDGTGSYIIYIDSDRSVSTGFRGGAGTWGLGADHQVRCTATD